MPPPSIPIVDLATGLIADASPESMTLDVPADLGGEARQASLDGVGLLHYAGADGQERACTAAPRRLSERDADETCLVSLAERDRDSSGRLVYRLHVLES
jgi:hypothetical protein